MILQLPSLPKFLEIVADGGNESLLGYRNALLVRGHIESLALRYITLLGRALTESDASNEND